MANQNLPELKETTDDSTGKYISPPNIGSTINTKEMVIAFGAVLVAIIIFFVIKNFVSKMLVSSYKKSPRSADMAGWSLFCVLLFAAITSVLGVLDSSKFFSFLYLIPIGLVMLVALIMFIVALRSKR